jgi:hypothetical protein
VFRARELVHISSQTVTITTLSSCILHFDNQPPELNRAMVLPFYDFDVPVNEIVLLSGCSWTTVYQILRLYDTFGQVTKPHENNVNNSSRLAVN